MWISEPRPWNDPLEYAAAIPESETRWALLYSGLRTRYSGGHSLLALFPEDEVIASNFNTFASKLTADKPWQENSWFGWLGYGLKDALEHLPADRIDASQSFASALPPLWMTRYGLLLDFDHEKRSVTLHAATPHMLTRCPAPIPFNEMPEPPTGGRALLARNVGVADKHKITSLSSPSSRADYLHKVNEILENIRAGNLYQANLTRKFTGTFASPPNALTLFQRLTELSPAPYSAFLRFGDAFVLSSSPERFLSVSPQGAVEARPIKGTAPRDPDPTRDEALRQALAESTKDRAENLMIVDLMRNDLARGCVPGSVTVNDLFEIHSYATVHHMATAIRGQKRTDCSTLDLIKQCFPPGSMTGAPKIAAMQLCTQLETLARGPYAGAIGWFGGDGGADLSVVIRTLLLQGNRFEFQVGGGIVADSNPEAEWRETLTKARAIAETLHIEPESLASL